jgi:DNA-binding transcriptional ArsR family regulator
MSKKSSQKSAALPDAALEILAQRFRALSEPVRLRLLNTLMLGEQNVTQLVEASGTGQANVSKHLAVLKQAGMVSTRREGLNTVCFISDPTIFQLCQIMCDKLKADHAALGRQMAGM